MTWKSAYIMRQEILLTILILYQLLADLSSKTDKRNVMLATILAFLVITISGFLPSEPAALFGSMYVSDPLRLTMKSILCIFTLIVLLQASGWLQGQHQHKTGVLFLLLLATVLGMFFMISAGDFLMLYLGLEMATLPLTLLAALDKDLRHSAEAGLKLLFSSAVSSAVLLFGLSFLYGIYGTLHFSGISAGAGTSSLATMAILFFIAGLGFKISLVPFHLWTADVYEGSPMPVTAFFSVVSKGAALFSITLILFRVFPQFQAMWSMALYILSIATMFVGALFALRQKNLKRFLAFSSITQAGFMLLGFMAKEDLGVSTIVYFMLIYGLSNLAAFGVLSIVSNATGKETMDDLNGFYSTNPRLSLILLASLFSLAGIPPLAGFFGKLFLFTAAASAGMYILVLLAVLNATLSLYYYLLVVKAIFITPNDAPIARLRSTAYEKLAFTVCLAGILLAGVASPVFEHIRSILH